MPLPQGVNSWADGCAGRSLEVGDEEEEAEKKVRADKDQVRLVHPALQDQDDYRCAPTDFFEDARNHQRPKALRVRRDDDKGDLPRQADPHESIEESWMRDGRRIIAPYEIKHEVKRGEDKKAPNARNPK